ncbi:MAG: DUF4825 domain-containing protein [Defluviitaleaceae bacterium]|nr:DUF4825 domain-containing protein [Defluviitaleaceae bacterium]
MHDIFITVLNMSITGSFVIAAVWLARLLLKKAPKSASYLLWVVVGFRLLFPFSIESAFSLIPFNSSQPITQNLAILQVPAIPSMPVLESESILAPMPVNTTVQYGSIISGNFAPLDLYSAAPAQFLWWPNVFAGVWLTGVVAMLLYAIVSYYMLSLRMASARRIGSNVYKAKDITSPFVLGIIKPKIYLPIDLKNHERDYVLLHEQSHISRKDHIVKLVAYFALALHWFNPLVWVSFLLMGKDMEMSCDERVIKKMGVGIKKDYTLTLLSMATGNKIINAGPLSFGEGGIKERVKNVLKFKKPSQIFIIFILLVVVALSVGLAMNRANNAANAYEYTGDEQNGTASIQGTPYVGAAHETARIVGYMPQPASGWWVQGIQIGQDHGQSGHGPYTLTVYYEPLTYHAARLMWEVPVQNFYANADFLFEHIGNLQAVSFSVNTGQTGRVDSDIYVYRWNVTSGDYAAELIVNERRSEIQETWTWHDYTQDDISIRARQPGSYTGAIAIVNNTLYLDQVEIIFIHDQQRIDELWPNWVEEQQAQFPSHDWTLYDKMPSGYYIRHINVELVNWNNEARIAELGLDPETALNDGWPYEYRISAQTLSFEITPETIFEFVDAALDLPCTLPYGNRYRATNLQNFIQARPWLADESLAGASTFRRVPMYVQVNSHGQVVRVVEEFFLTQ